MENGTPDITQSSVLLLVQIGKPGNRRKVSSSSVEVDADKDAINVSKELLDSPELRAIGSFDARLRRWLYERALPAAGTLKSGVHRLPVTLVEEIDEWLNDQRYQRDRMVDNFLAVYIEQSVAARDRLRSLYRDQDYPPAVVVKRAFRFEWRYLALGVPDQLKGISSAMFQREHQKAKLAIASEVDEIKDALRTSFADLLDKAVDRLAVSQDGRPVVFRDSLIGNMEGFLEYFGDRNLVDDTALEDMVARARQVLRGVDEPGVLRNDMELRERVQASFAAIRGEMDANQMVRPKRQIAFDDD